MLSPVGSVPTTPDATLIERCLAGSEPAWNTLVDRYARLVESIPRRHGFDQADTEDVAQGVFISLFRNLHQLRQTERLSSWLITTAYRETWRIGRRRKLELPEELDAAADGDIPEEEIAQLERCQMVRDALARLGGICARLLERIFLRPTEPSYAEISSELDIPVGSIGPTRARCLQKLEPILRKLGLEPDS